VHARARNKIRKQKSTACSELKPHAKRVSTIVSIVKRNPKPEVIQELINESLLLRRSLVAAIQFSQGKKKDAKSTAILKKKLKENNQLLKTARKLLHMVELKERSHKYPKN
ncbi:hypothetical protein KKE06_01775, partial [Candidatus Micrarchaeota archaeon]|nr:hypothetical protein [Candidatus Micrarchaeota archaeon]MBU1930482.1 hypothetical protein [Candidatus Micrarchaeota archaeon]